MNGPAIKDLLEPGIRGVYLAAEVGTNHNGSLETALDMIDRFAAFGAQGLKFQFLRAGGLYPDDTPVADYLVEHGVAEKNTGINELIRKVELKEAWLPALMERCSKKRAEFLCSVFDTESLEVLVRAGIGSIKIASTEITHYPLLAEVGKTGLPVILSTGMANLGEIEKALVRIGHDRVILLHCTAAYPAPAEEVNLRAMVNLGVTFGLPTGFSDHTKGYLAAACAVSLGAIMVEKHVTLDRNQPGPDHHFASPPHEFGELAVVLTQAKSMLGSAVKRPTASEKDLAAYRPGLFAAGRLDKGEVLSLEKLRVMRRNRAGIGVEHLEIVLGRELRRSLEPGQVLEWEDI